VDIDPGGDIVVVPGGGSSIVGPPLVDVASDVDACSTVGGSTAHPSGIADIQPTVIHQRVQAMI
jgi:hypothetical protein